MAVCSQMIYYVQNIDQHILKHIQCCATVTYQKNNESALCLILRQDLFSGTWPDILTFKLNQSKNKYAVYLCILARTTS